MNTNTTYHCDRCDRCGHGQPTGKGLAPVTLPASMALGLKYTLCPRCREALASFLLNEVAP